MRILLLITALFMMSCSDSETEEAAYAVTIEYISGYRYDYIDTGIIRCDQYHIDVNGFLCVDLQGGRVIKIAPGNVITISDGRGGDE